MALLPYRFGGVSVLTYSLFTPPILVGPTQMDLLHLVAEQPGISNTDLRAMENIKSDSTAYNLRKNGLIYAKLGKAKKSPTTWFVTKTGETVLTMKKDQNFKAFSSWNAFQASLKKPKTISPSAPQAVPPPQCLPGLHFSAAKPGEVCPMCSIYIPQNHIKVVQ